MHADEFIRSCVRRWGYSAAARFLAKHGIGSPEYFIACCSDLLPRRHRPVSPDGTVRIR